MMIKITEQCSMGCSHCMNNATPNGKHMDPKTFRRAIAFQKKYGGPFVIITGGEPTNHPRFIDYLLYAANELSGCYITVTTNGIWMLSHASVIKEIWEKYGSHIMFQVTNDERYYPTPLLSHSVFELENVILCDRVEHIYPQGRALENGLEWNSKASKCFNVRAITHQVNFKDLRTIIGMLAVKGKFCTPHISIDGHIKLGESDLCPNCSHIDKTNNEIIDDIMNFRCNGCNHINSQLPKEYLEIIGEA